MIWIIISIRYSYNALSFSIKFKHVVNLNLIFIEKDNFFYFYIKTYVRIFCPYIIMANLFGLFHALLRFNVTTAHI